MAGFESLPSLPVPAHFHEPFGDQHWNKPYGASPARPYGDPETEARQEMMNIEFNKLYEFPPEELKIPDSFKKYLIDVEKFARIKRNLTNHYHYEAWRKTNPEIPHYRLEDVYHYEKGQASIKRIGSLAASSTLQAFLAGKLTHPYWQRIGSLPDMRDETALMIESLGGLVYEYPDHNPYRSIKIQPYTTLNPDTSKEEIQGISVEYLRDFGTMRLPGKDRVHMVERQIAGYRVDEASQFPQEILEAMHNPSIFISEPDTRDFSWTNLQDPRHEIFMDKSGCKEFITQSVQSNSVEPFVVPIETSEFGYKGDNIHTENYLAQIALKP